MNEQERQEFLMDMRESFKMEAEEKMWEGFDQENDVVNKPSHYQSPAGLESIDVIQAFVPDPYSFCMGNTIKYILRHVHKHQKQDLEKARWYLNRMIEEWD